MMRCLPCKVPHTHLDQQGLIVLEWFQNETGNEQLGIHAVVGMVPQVESLHRQMGGGYVSLKRNQRTQVKYEKQGTIKRHPRGSQGGA